jgi:hypothetical protein
MRTFNQQRNFEVLKSLLKEKESQGYVIKEVTEEGDVMGELLGCQFDSEERGGYVYFWSTGVVGRQLLDYKTGEELIEDATGEMDDDKVSVLITELVAKL